MHRQMQHYYRIKSALAPEDLLLQAKTYELIPLSNFLSDFNPCSGNEFNGTFLFLGIYSLELLIN